LVEAYNPLLDFGQPVDDRLAEIVAQDAPELGDSTPALPALWQAAESSDDCG